MKIGFLPLYIALYDRTNPECRPTVEAFAETAAARLRERGFEVAAAPVCCVRAEIEAALARFREAGAHAVVTLHLAYSPSLEAADALAACDLPLAILDTTPDFEFGYGDAAAKLMFNHGIHGVQDLTNLLLRRHKVFAIEAGHMDHSDVLDRLAARLRAADAAWHMRRARVGAVGGEFAGMGDFRFDLKDLPLDIVPYAPQQVSEEEARREAALDRERFVCGEFDEATLLVTERESLKIRRWVESAGLDAFTVCFPGINRPEWACVPFLEASKAMARGIGYAGEGDVLTAAYCAAVMKMFPETTFSEMFCPDWKRNRIFVSHMGEINAALTAAPPLLHEVAYHFSDTGNMVVATGCLKPGRAVLSNLAPAPEGRFLLTAAEIALEAPETPSETGNTGWFAPAGGDVGAFLAEYSRRGGTHHLLISYGGEIGALATFAAYMGWDFRVIQ